MGCAPEDRFGRGRGVCNFEAESLPVEHRRPVDIHDGQPDRADLYARIDAVIRHKAMIAQAARQEMLIVISAASPDEILQPALPGEVVRWARFWWSIPA